LPTTIVQEGGYAVEALRRNLGSFLGGFLSERRVSG
jgi:acetoin utilization deacetylase AcuC-like enzyme